MRLQDLTIIHGGQTGVDRGAHIAATEISLKIDGFMPSDLRDELGIIPTEVRRVLRASNTRGYKTRTISNLRLCDLLVIIVERRPITAGTILTLTEAVNRSIPFRVRVDPILDPTLNEEIVNLAPKKLMIAGPRASRWPDGEWQTRLFLRNLAGRIRGKAV